MSVTNETLIHPNTALIHQAALSLHRAAVDEMRQREQEDALVRALVAAREHACLVKATLNPKPQNPKTLNTKTPDLKPKVVRAFVAAREHTWLARMHGTG